MKNKLVYLTPQRRIPIDFDIFLFIVFVASKISPQPKDKAHPRLKKESETTTDYENDNPKTQHASPFKKLSLFRDGRSAEKDSLEETDAEDEDEGDVEVPKKKK